MILKATKKFNNEQVTKAFLIGYQNQMEINDVPIWQLSYCIVNNIGKGIKLIVFFLTCCSIILLYAEGNCTSMADITKPDVQKKSHDFYIEAWHSRTFFFGSYCYKIRKGTACAIFHIDIEAYTSQLCP